MTFLKWGLFLLLCTFYTLCSAQDTVSVFFQLDDANLQDEEARKLSLALRSYDLNEIDSVYYIGMADTTGNTRLNLKLSEKRARNVAKYCKRFFPVDYHHEVIAAGEKRGKNVTQYRRVDIVMYSQPPAAAADSAAGSALPQGCYYIDYFTLHSCHIETVKKAKKEYTLLYIEQADLHERNKDYTGIFVNDSVFRPVKLHWRSKITGRLWWRHRRYVATIPKQDFERFKIFTIEKPPCDTCYAQFTSEMHVTKVIKSYDVDVFLMRNIQLRKPLFATEKMKIRVPREYVNLGNRQLSEYAGFKWTLPEKGRRSRYAYAELPIVNDIRREHMRYPPFGRLCNIYSLMDRYAYCYKPQKREYFFIKCGYVGQDLIPLLIYVEEGGFYRHSQFTPLAGMGIAISGLKNQIYTLAGIAKYDRSNDGNFYASVKYQHSFKPFGFNPFSPWYYGSSEKLIERYGRVYVGTELKTCSPIETQRYVEQNIHIGVACLNVNKDGLTHRIFLQCGTGLELQLYNDGSSPDVKPILFNNSRIRPVTFLQAGIDFMLAKPYVPEGSLLWRIESVL